ncbi:MULTISPECIES: universal stress protein [unclassified Kitasatospora]|uniref:universal stress protein n=1 Tax=unclassified Kitasatospora TaxID=2633591 RepID=UPI00380B43A0
MTQKILSGYDGSPQSRAAVEWAAAEAVRREAELTLLRVWHWLGTAGPEGPDAAPLQQAEHDDLETLAADLLAAHPELSVCTQAAAGDPTDALLELAAGYDLVVLGSHGPGALADMLGTSVALSVAARAACPVVLVREHPAEENALQPVGDPRAAVAARTDADVPVEPDARMEAEVLAEAETLTAASAGTTAPGPATTATATLPTATATATAVDTDTDTLTAVEAPAMPGSGAAVDTPTRLGGATARPEIVVALAGDSSLPAVEFALAEAARSGAVVRAVHGWEMVPLWAGAPGWLPPDPDPDHRSAQIEADLTRALAGAAAAHPEVELRVEARLGGAVGAVVAAAEHADLVVVGRRPHLLGSDLGAVAHAAVQHSTAPVALVPHA